VVYECLLCSSDQAWPNPKRDNAIYHAKRKHSDIINSSDNTVLERSSDIGPPLKQARLGDYYTANPSESALRRVFNPQRYTESMVALLARRRLPFSAVTWDEMQDIMLACNPAIEDLIMTSRHEAMRQHLVEGDVLYRGIAKGCHVLIWRRLNVSATGCGERSINTEPNPHVDATDEKDLA
jgi:hypothetical protein